VSYWISVIVETETHAHAQAPWHYRPRRDRSIACQRAMARVCARSRTDLTLLKGTSRHLARSFVRASCETLVLTSYRYVCVCALPMAIVPTIQVGECHRVGHQRTQASSAGAIAAQSQQRLGAALVARSLVEPAQRRRQLGQAQGRRRVARATQGPLGRVPDHVQDRVRLQRVDYEQAVDRCLDQHLEHHFAVAIIVRSHDYNPFFARQCGSDYDVDE